MRLLAASLLLLPAGRAFAQRAAPVEGNLSPVEAVLGEAPLSAEDVPARLEGLLELGRSAPSEEERLAAAQVLEAAAFGDRAEPRTPLERRLALAAQRLRKAASSDPLLVRSIQKTAEAAKTGAEPAGPLPAPDPAVVERVAAALFRGDWEAKELDGEDGVLAAYEAERAGLISKGQLSTAILRWEAFEELQPASEHRAAHDLLDEQGRLTPLARGMVGRIYAWRTNVKGLRVGLTEGELADFEARLRALPESERKVWIVPLSKERFADAIDPSSWAHGASRIMNSVHVQAFQTGDWFRFAVPSFGMLQAYLDARFKKDAVRLEPAFGIQTRADVLADLGEGARVLALAFPGVASLRKADGLTVGYWTYSMHDFFHAYVGSHFTLDYRKVLARVVRLGRAWATRRTRAAWEGKEDAVSDLKLHALRLRSVRLGSGLAADFESMGPVFLTRLAADMLLRSRAWPWRRAVVEAFVLLREAWLGPFVRLFKSFCYTLVGRPA